MKMIDIKEARELFHEIHEKASRLWFYASNLRVTHTNEQLDRVVKAVHVVDKIANPTDDFIRDFKRGMNIAKAASAEITMLNDQELHISGVFSVEALRQIFIVVRSAPTISS